MAKFEKGLNIDKEALEEKAEALLEKAVEKKKVGMFRGIQSRIMIVLIITMLVCTGTTVAMAINEFSKELTEKVSSEMLSLATAYGGELYVATLANGGEMLTTPTLQEIGRA